MSKEKEREGENIYERIRRLAREKQEKEREQQKQREERLAPLTSWGGIVRL